MGVSSTRGVVQEVRGCQNGRMGTSAVASKSRRSATDPDQGLGEGQEAGTGGGWQSEERMLVEVEGGLLR
jgi:hypothetical protein